LNQPAVWPRPTTNDHPMIRDGYTDLTPGKIAAVVTYLEMRERPVAAETNSHVSQMRRDPSAGSGQAMGHPQVRSRRIENPGLDWYRKRYRRAGGPWLWFSRLEMSDEQLASVLRRATTEVFMAEHELDEIGIAELDRSDAQNVEITTFALFAEWQGRGLGQRFMAEVLARAWSGDPARVWLHTCTLDGPGALAFYLKCGFRAYKRAIEVADDPRVRGFLPLDAAPGVPIIR